MGLARVENRLEIVWAEVEDPAESGHEASGARSDPDQQEVAKLEVELGGRVLAQVSFLAASYSGSSASMGEVSP